MNMKETHKYDDIINMEYPLKSSNTLKHPRMSIEDRAKIFAPFAALTGYEKAIAAKQKIVVPRVELSEDLKEILDLQINKIEYSLEHGEHPIITVVYFQKDKQMEDGGEYIKFTGMVGKLNRTSGVLQIVDRKLFLKDICRIEY